VPARPLRIGTRGSPMALYQTGFVRDRLQSLHPELAAEGAVELVPIRTTGDRVQTRLLAEIGGKGLFTKEIEEALLDRRIDFAVHSLKDMETVLPASLVIGCVLPRDDPRDVLVTGTGATLLELPRGARIGTASLRRRAQLLRERADLEILPIRGNVGTRLGKLAAGEVDGLVLALCGLERLGKAGVATEILSPERMLPAVGQGALAIECRADDSALRQLLMPLNDAASAACVACERAMLAALDGSCRTPIAGNAEVRNGTLHFRGMILKPDGSEAHETVRDGSVQDAEVLGADAGRELKGRAPADFFRH